MRLALVVLAGCGRLGFDSTTDGSIDPADTVVDTADADGSGLVARYAMDEVPVSSIAASDPRFDAPCGPCPGSIPGRLGNAIQFAGDLRVALPGQLIGLAPFTVAVWIHPASLGLMSAVSKPAGPAGPNNALSLTIDEQGRARYESSVAGAIVEFPELGDNLHEAWHHLAASWDGALRRFYIDGAAVGEQPGSFDDSSLAVGIGADLDDNAPAIFYTGGLDELRFYDRALADAEITALANP